jgi:phosphoglycerate dehydrogenase-like enzyme
VRPVASSILLLVLAASHNLVAKDRMIRRGEWAGSTRRLGREPRGRIIGSIGLGNIASEAIRLLQPLQPAGFLAYDPYATQERAAGLGVRLVTLEELLAASDYVLVNCPLTPDTRGLLGEQELRRMKPGAVLINTARGPIIDQSALIRVLQEGVIACAALDVFEQEPLPDDSPLRDLENVILSSHSLCWTEELFRDMGRESFAGVVALCNGRAPAHVVNPEVLDRPLFREKVERFGLRV